MRMLPLVIFLLIVETCLSQAVPSARHIATPTPAAAGSSSTLNTGLVAYWKLDEASGSRADSVGASTLTDNNTVTSTTGKIGDASVFVRANDESLSVTDNEALSMGDIDFNIAGWFQLADIVTAGTHDIVAKFTSGSLEYILLYTIGTGFRFYVSSNGTATANVIASAFGTGAANTWYFVQCGHDSANNVIFISVNNGTVNTTSTSAGVFDGTSAFYIGDRGGVSSNNLGGLVDELGIWKKRLSTTELTELYNAGTGKTYPF